MTRNGSPEVNSSAITEHTGLKRWAHGLAMLRGYRKEWLRNDVAAGLSVAAVALPVAIAYAQLAGFPPVVGLYASILPLVVYAALGTSRQLIVNPDAATSGAEHCDPGGLAAGRSPQAVSAITRCCHRRGGNGGTAGESAVNVVFRGHRRCSVPGPR